LCRNKRSDDIVKRVLDCLELMLGRDAAHSTIPTATQDEGDPEDLMRDWIDRQFWKHHFATASWTAGKQNNRLGCALARRVLCRFSWQAPDGKAPGDWGNRTAA